MKIGMLGFVERSRENRESPAPALYKAEQAFVAFRAHKHGS